MSCVLSCGGSSHRRYQLSQLINPSFIGCVYVCFSDPIQHQRLLNVIRFLAGPTHHESVAKSTSYSVSLQPKDTFVPPILKKMITVLWIL